MQTTEPVSVDRRIRQLLLEDELLPSARTQEATGSVPERAESVLRALAVR